MRTGLKSNKSTSGHTPRQGTSN